MQAQPRDWLADPTLFGEPADLTAFRPFPDEGGSRELAERRAAVIQHRFVLEARQALRGNPDPDLRRIAHLARELEMPPGTLGNYFVGRAWLPLSMLLAIADLLERIDLIPVIDDWSEVDL